MAILGDPNLIYPVKEKFNYFGTFQASKLKKNSETVNFFDQLYSYPQKLNLKWDLLNGVDKKEVWQTFNNVVYRWDPNYDIVEQVNTKKSKYSLSDYLDGYSNKINSSRFYTKKTKRIQNSLANVPVFVVLNGDNEIVLTKSINPEKPSSLQTYAKGIIYNTCGAFDFNSEGCQNLGLFFLDYADAENFLNNIAKSDIDGTKTVGLSIHCVGLDSAYNITREDHPETDFRFISPLGENTTTAIGVPVYIVGINELSDQTKSVKFVFFDEKNARTFYKSQSNKDIVTLSKDSLENFLEVWEDQIQNQNLVSNSDQNEYKLSDTYFISSYDTENLLKNSPKLTRIKKTIQSFQQKTRILKRSVGIFFSLV